MNILTRYGCLQSSADSDIRARLDMPSRAFLSLSAVSQRSSPFLARSFMVIAASGRDCKALPRRCRLACNVAVDYSRGSAAYAWNGQMGDHTRYECRGPALAGLARIATPRNRVARAAELHQLGHSRPRNELFQYLGNHFA